MLLIEINKGYLIEVKFYFFAHNFLYINTILCHNNKKKKLNNIFKKKKNQRRSTYGF